MNAGMFLAVGLTGVLGYFGWTAMNHDPAIVSMSVDEVTAKLAGSETRTPGAQGNGSVVIRAGSRSGNTIPMTIDYPGDHPTFECSAVMEMVSDAETKVFADCGAASQSSALNATTRELKATMFDEHIQSTLEGRAFDRGRVSARQQGLVLKNRNELQREALAKHDSMNQAVSEATDRMKQQEMQEEVRRMQAQGRPVPVN